MATPLNDGSGSGHLTTIGTVAAAVAAAVVAAWRLTPVGMKDGKHGAKSGAAEIKTLDDHVERTARLLSSAGAIIDQLQEENARLASRLAAAEQRTSRLEDMVAELRMSRGR